MTDAAGARAVGVGGVFFRARDPEALALWYRTHLGVGGDANTGAPWRQEAGFTVFAPFPADTDYFGRAEQAFMINFRVDDLDALLARLRAAGIEAETRPDEWDGPHGRFARIHDPEGNPVELWEPPRDAV
ncbi:MAG: VOC family protein [Pseudomonadota bacterium]